MVLLSEGRFFTSVPEVRGRIARFGHEYKAQSAGPPFRSSTSLMSAATDRSAVIVLTTIGEAADAVSFARMLVNERLAACVNVLPPMTSLYWWKGAIEEDREQQLIIKTTSDRVSVIEARFREIHPYELPEFLILSAEASAAYLEWAGESVTAT